MRGSSPHSFSRKRGLVMAAVLCPRCKNPLDIPKPMPEKIRCGKCGTTFKNSARPKGSPAPAAASAGAGAAAGAAGAATAQAVADRRAAKSIAKGDADADATATATEPAKGMGKSAALIGGGVAAVVVLG